MREQPNKRALEFVVKVQNFIQKVFPSMQCVHLLDFITTWNWLVGKGQLSVGIVHWPYIRLFYTLLDLTSLAGKPLKIRIIIKEKNTGESLKQVRRILSNIILWTMRKMGGLVRKPFVGKRGKSNSNTLDILPSGFLPHLHFGKRKRN